MRLWRFNCVKREKDPVSETPKTVYIQLDNNFEFKGGPFCTVRDDLNGHSFYNDTEVYAEYELKTFKKVTCSVNISTVENLTKPE